jgi:hypothetical protein
MRLGTKFAPSPCLKNCPQTVNKHIDLTFCLTADFPAARHLRKQNRLRSKEALKDETTPPKVEVREHALPPRGNSDQGVSHASKRS